MEYFKHGDLRSAITASITEDEARDITRQLLEGLRVMHENGFTHRDMKPEVVTIEP